jgi:hypothetical protein
VISLNDSGPGSLRLAIDNAKPVDTITIDPALHGTLHLSKSLIIKKNLTINGPPLDSLGAPAVTIQYDDQASSGTTPIQLKIAPEGSLDISGIAFKNSKTATYLINNEGSLTLTNCLITKNTVTAQYGGIVNTGTLVLNNSIISDNTLQPGDPVDAFGGGISNIGDGSVTITSTVISGNRVISSQGHTAGGGGISNNGKGLITVEKCSIFNNAVIGNQQASGGGIYTQNNGTVTLNKSIVSGNTVTSSSGNSEGGGIYGSGNSPKQAVTIALTDSTVFGNKATSSSGSSSGGGIYSSALSNDQSTTHTNVSTIIPLILNNTTITGNSVSTDQGSSKGGGILVLGEKGVISSCTIYGNAATSPDSSGGGIKTSADSLDQKHITISDTIVANNHALSGPDLSGTITSHGYNLIQDFSDITFNSPSYLHQTDLSGATFPTLGIDPQFKNNGGLTLTHALLRGSPAIDRIPRTACDNALDQRGMKRPQGSACDIGAYEYIPTKNM